MGTIKKHLERCLFIGRLAERVGFEPTLFICVFKQLSASIKHLGRFWGEGRCLLTFDAPVSLPDNPGSIRNLAGHQE
jgi:hypothetical protein